MCISHAHWINKPHVFAAIYCESVFSGWSQDYSTSSLLCVLIHSIFCLILSYQGFLWVQLSYWTLPLRFSLSPPQCFCLLMESHSQARARLPHFLQSGFSDTTQEFILLKFCFLNFIDMFLCVFKLLEFFGEVYDFPFKFCVLGFTWVIFYWQTYHFYRTGRVGEKILPCSFIMFVIC